MLSDHVLLRLSVSCSLCCHTHLTRLLDSLIVKLLVILRGYLLLIKRLIHSVLLLICHILVVVVGKELLLSGILRAIICIIGAGFDGLRGITRIVDEEFALST